MIPDELELLKFFGTAPVERSVEDGYWGYEAVAPRGMALRFSFNLSEYFMTKRNAPRPLNADEVALLREIRLTG